MEVYSNSRKYIDSNIYCGICFFPKSDGITNKYGSLVFLRLTFMLQFTADSGTLHNNSICKYWGAISFKTIKHSETNFIIYPKF